MEPADNRLPHRHPTDEPPQDHSDLLRLLATLQQAAPPDPERQRVRNELLAKLADLLETPGIVRGGGRVA